MTRTRAQQQLAKRARERGWTQTRLAEVLGVDQSTVSLWMSGQARPEPPHRKALDVILGIPEADWLTAEERAVVARAQSFAKTGTDGR